MFSYDEVRISIWKIKIELHTALAKHDDFQEWSTLLNSKRGMNFFINNAEVIFGFYNILIIIVFHDYRANIVKII